MTTANSRAQQGVSLIEALLALVVMAVGMLGVVGLQATLRSNGDLSRQRAEAVRMAQETLETWRSFTRVESDGAQFDFTDDIVPVAATAVPAAVANTTFNRERLVTAAWPGMKSLSVRVTWQDRSGQDHEVALHSAVARVAPELAGSLAIPPQGAPTRQPLGRHPAIPPSALPQADGSWRFTPPPTATDRPAWFFNATTGLITRICTDAADNSTCASATSQFLTGFVRYAVGMSQPTSADALNPPSTLSELLAVINPAPGLQTSVQFTTSENPTAATADCFVGSTSSDPNAATEYFCAVPLALSVPGVVPSWSGRLYYYTNTTPDRVTANAGDSSNDKTRICRYFDLAGSGNYSAVKAPLSNQNYLVIRAGNGADPAFVCPTPVTVAHPRS